MRLLDLTLTTAYKEWDPVPSVVEAIEVKLKETLGDSHEVYVVRVTVDKVDPRGERKEDDDE